MMVEPVTAGAAVGLSDSSMRAIVQLPATGPPLVAVLVFPPSALDTKRVAVLAVTCAVRSHGPTMSSLVIVSTVAPLVVQHDAGTVDATSEGF
jgi:hypothetical protein